MLRSTHRADAVDYAKLSASWGHPNRDTPGDAFVLAAGPDPVFVLRNRDCHAVGKPLRQHRRKSVLLIASWLLG